MQLATALGASTAQQRVFQATDDSILRAVGHLLDEWHPCAPGPGVDLIV